MHLQLDSLCLTWSNWSDLDSFALSWIHYAFLVRMAGLSSGAWLVFVKPAFGRLSFLIKHMLGARVLCLGLACHHASSLGFALSHLVSVGLTWIQMHPLGFTIMCLFRMPGASSGAWIRFVSLGLHWYHLDSDALTWIHYHVSFSDAWLIIGCSACICKACLRQAWVPVSYVWV
jgi:hypothetical protein